jgi:electron transfer flavoprotein alpha subunit
MKKIKIHLPVIDLSTCISCGACIETCATQAIQGVGEFPQLDQPDLCSFCGDCEEICPTHAIIVPFTIRWAAG